MNQEEADKALKIALASPRVKDAIVYTLDGDCDLNVTFHNNRTITFLTLALVRRTFN